MLDLELGVISCPRHLEINPGFLTVVKKKIIEEFERDNGQNQEDLLL